MKSLFTLLACTLLSAAHAQAPTKTEVLQKFGFTEHHIAGPADSIAFYSYHLGSTPPSNLVLYLHGSEPDPLFTYRMDNDGPRSFRWFPGDYKQLDSTWMYVIGAKSGLGGVWDEAALEVPEHYHQLNSLDHRVARADAIIRYAVAQLLSQPSRVVVYGHSEGAPVAAKLGTINEHITHLGFWAGNALPEWYDFMLFSARQSWTGALSGAEAQTAIYETLEGFEEVAQKRTSTEVEYGYTAKRWWSYAEPPMNHLLQLDIPIHVQVATHDESSPIESTFVLPLEFTRLGKNNLSYNVCAGCDHGFWTGKGKKRVSHWPAIFADFMRWIERN